MRMNAPKRVMIAGTGSGSGKTTVTCALLAVLKSRGGASSFKSGPDYIDPMFHKKVLGVSSHNLDLHLTDEDTVRYILGRYAGGVSVIEGVMGFYDGKGTSERFSSWELSQVTGTPVILVTGTKGASLSVAATVQGFQNFRQNNIKGVILNNTSAAMYPLYREMIERETGLRVCGYLPPVPEASLESRHLGLVTAEEVGDLQEKIGLLARTAEKTIDFEAVLEIAGAAGELRYREPEKIAGEPVAIGVARDKAFCFYYEAALDYLRDLGAELRWFSPLKEERLPEGISGLLLGGGYPELYGAELNRSLMGEVRAAVTAGMPTVAECGGYMYLQKSITASDGRNYPMAGAIDSDAYMTKKLNRFGYVTLTAERDSLLCGKGDSFPAHEFHYSDCTADGDAFMASKGGRAWPCVHGGETLFAGYPHFHFLGCPEAAKRFLSACREYQNKIRLI